MNAKSQNKETNKTRVVCIHLLNDYSGSPKVLSQSVMALINAGVEVELLTGTGGDGFLSGLVAKHKHCHFFYKRFDNKLFILFSYLLSQLSLFIKVLGYRNQDVVFYINTLLPFGGALAAKLVGKKVVYHIHETSISPKPLKQFLKWVVKLTSSQNIFVSNYLAKEEGISTVPSQVIYNAIDENTLLKGAQANYQYTNANGDFTVLMVCSLKQYKGVDQFIKLAHSTSNHAHIKYQLVLNASDTEVASYFEHLAIPNNLSLISRQIDLHPYYSNASLVVNLSLVDKWVETFGLTLLEAMAYGIPVIAPPVGGPSEFVENGIHGYKIDSYEINELAAIILKLSNDKLLTKLFSQNCREQVKLYNVNNFNSKLLELINDYK